MSKIKKVTIWYNPTTMTKPRWDLEKVFEDGSRERMVDVKDTIIKDILALLD